MALPIKFNSNIASKLKDKEMLDKAKAAKKSKPKSNSIMDIIERIRQDVELHLGQYKGQYQLIRDKETLAKYIEKANEYGKIAIDTETTGLNPLVDNIVGLCLYFPNEPATYVPINHYNYFSDTRIDEQLTEEEVREVLQNLTAKCIMHNSQFDIRVIKHTIKHILKIFWDTLLAAQLIDENEAHGLKYLHGKYISKTNEKTFNDLFGEIDFRYVPIEYAYLYAAHDAIDTFELYEWQEKILTEDDPYTKDLFWLFNNIEIPMVDVVVDLEDTGVAVDTDYLKFLHDKYHENLSTAMDKCIAEIEPYIDDIEKYNARHIDQPFRLPPEISSPTQLAILFYDILDCKTVPGKKGRSTDVDVMMFFAKKYPLAKAILDYRAAQKITSTYVDNIPDIMHTDGRVHTHFNSNGAKTGRMSSSNPLNLQNIPSHNDEVRKMFVGQTTTRDVELRNDNAYIFDRCEEVELADGNWQWVELLKPGDILSTGEVVKVVKVKEFKVLVGI